MDMCVEGVTCAEVLTGEGLGLRHSPEGGDWGSAIPSFVGIWPSAFPFRCWWGRFGFIAFSIPHSAAAGALAQQRKKAQEGPCVALLFFVHRHPLCKQACNGLPVYKKSPQALLESFFCCCAVRGGFEPPVRLPVRQFSKLVVSATHPSHLSAQWVICLHKRFGTAKIC